jgi:hypothetical protein
MKELLTVSTPKPIDTMFDNLFLQTASTFGCGDHLYIQDNRRSVACDAGCSNCKVQEIMKKFNQQVEQFNKTVLSDYVDHVRSNELYPPDESNMLYTPLKTMLSHR